MPEEEDDDAEVDAEAPGLNGRHQAKQRSTAELLGTVGRRGGDGGYASEVGHGDAEAGELAGTMTRRGRGQMKLGHVQGIRGGVLIRTRSTVASRWQHPHGAAR